MTERIRTGNVEPVEVYITNRRSEPLTGLTSIYVRVRRVSDGYYLDWNDLTFKNTGWTTLNQITTEVDATNFPGLYKVTGGLDTSSITNPTADDDYQILTLESPADEAVVPPPALLRVGQWVDQIDTVWDKLPTNYIMGSGVQTDKDDEIDAILADTAAMEPLVSANVDATISSREAETDAASRAATNQSEHDATQADIAALENLSAAQAADAVWDELLSGHLIAGSAGQALARVDVDVSTRAVPGDAMDLVTDAVDANAVAADAVTEIANGTADQVWEEALADHSGTVGSTAEALDNAGSVPLSPAVIADAVWDEALSGHLVGGSAGEALDRVDVDVSTRTAPGDQMDLVAGALDSNSLDATAVNEIADGVWDEALSGHTGAGTTGQAQNRLDANISTRAAPGDGMDLVTGALDADAVATSGAQEIADAVWDEPLAGHVAVGSAGEAQNHLDEDISSRAEPGDAMTLTVGERGSVADSIWDEPLAGHLGAGSTGKALQDAGATADPSAIADAVWDEAAAGHVAAGSMGLLQNRLDANVSSRAAPGDAMDLVTDAVDATALASDAVGEIADGVWDEALAGHAGVGSTGEAQARLDAAITTRAVPGDAMDLVTDALDSNALATSAVNDIADQVWEETLADHSGTAGSTAEALDNVTAPASPAVIADAVWDEALSGHTAAGTAGEAQNRLDDIETDTNAIDSRLPADPADESNQLAQHSATQAAIAGLNDVTANEVRDAILSDSTPFDGADVAAILADTDAIDSRLPTDPADESNQLAQHAATQAAIAGLNDLTGAQIADAVWDEPIAGHLAAGTTGKALDDAKATADPGAIADAVWDEALSGHVAAGSTGEAQNRLDADISSRESETDAATRAGTDVAEHNTTQAAIAALNDPSAGEIADAVWDETLADHLTAGSTGNAQNQCGGGTGAYQIALTIEDISTSDPIPGAQIDVLRSDDTFLTRVYSDINGEKTIALDAGSYKLVVQANGYTFTVPEILVVTGNAPFTVQGTSVVPPPAGPDYCVIFGTVRNAAGDPIVNACVEAYSIVPQVVGGVQHSEKVASENTDVNGQFTMPLLRNTVVRFIIESTGVDEIRTVPDAATQDIATWTAP